MTEPAGKETHHLKTSHATSGGNGAVFEHPSANENCGTEGDRGRYGGDRQPDSDGSSTANKLWRMRGGQREVCPGSVAGNALPKCPTASQPSREPGTDSAGDYALAAHGNSGDGPNEETMSQVQGESGTPVTQRRVNSDGFPGVGAEARHQGKKKHRRRSSKKKRRWKPYYKLSWEEKKALEERETARASRVRAEMFAKGLPVAPYNTTQFLMDEHDREEPDLNTEIGGGRRLMMGLLGLGRPEDSASEDDLLEFDEEEDGDGSGGGGGSDGIGRPGNAGREFLQRDFSETYEKYHVESLQNMSKQELVLEYLELEKCMSRLEEENGRLRRCAVDNPGITTDSPPTPPDSSARLQELETELEKLKAQNSELRLQTYNRPCKDRGQTLTTAE